MWETIDYTKIDSHQLFLRAPGDNKNFASCYSIS